jgi:hypothetical protein
MTFKEVIGYRKASESAREEFLEHLSGIQAKQAVIGIDGDYRGAIERIVNTEIVPAVRNFRNKLATINESFYGALAKGVVGFSAGLNLLGELSWEKLLSLAGLAGAYIARSGIDAILSQRAVRRECSIAYLLDLDK